MFNWICENLSTIIVATILIAAVAAVISYLVKNKRRGGCGCGSGCSHCALQGKCRK